MLILSADLLIPAQNRRLASPFSSSSIFFDGLFWERLRAYPMNSPLSKAKFISTLKPKHQLNAHKHAGNRTATKKKKKKTGAGDAQPCAPGRMIVCPSPRPVVPSVWRGPDTSRTTRFELLWTTGCALDLHVLGLLGLLCYSLHLAWFQIILFSHKLGPNHANLQSQLNIAKTEHNRRNTCINRKLMQINPKFQAKNY